MAIFFIVGTSLLLTPTVHAESVLWTATPGVNLTSQSAFTYPYYLYNPAVQVQYHASAYDDATGLPVCGASVLRGTRVRFQFAPHVFEDVSWFGTGYSLDSPYGDWDNAAGMPGAMCSDKNYFMSQLSTHGAGFAGSSGQVEYFASFSVDPPTKQVVFPQPAFFACDAAMSDGSVTCTAQGSGTTAANFSFSIPPTATCIWQVLLHGMGVAHATPLLPCRA